MFLKIEDVKEPRLVGGKRGCMGGYVGTWDGMHKNLATKKQGLYRLLEWCETTSTAEFKCISHTLTLGACPDWVMTQLKNFDDYASVVPNVFGYHDSKRY